MLFARTASFVLALWLACNFAASASAAPFELKKGDRISIIGNTLADRMQHFGALETLLQLQHPEHELVIRNLGFSADTLTVRLRSANFGSPDEWLTRMKTSVVFAFFGYNESFAGEAGLPQFKTDLEQFLTHTLSQKYDGANPPRIALFSPIAHEDLTARDRNLPDGKANNERLKRYTAAMAEVAAKFADRGVAFVDLFEPTAKYEWKKNTLGPLTINGIHVTGWGDYVVASTLMKALFDVKDTKEWSFVDVQDHRNKFTAVSEVVRNKNFHWYERYRTTDGFSIYGGRADTPKDGLANRPVMAREMEVLDVMTANRDKAIWAAAQGKEFKLDDSNTPEFIAFPSNRKGPNADGSYPFYSGEEALKYITPGKNLKVSLFADESMFPEIVNPVQMAFDTKGRLWVAVWPSYPHWKPKDAMADKLLILEDTNGDGRADVCKTFAGDLHNPTGFEFYNGGVIVAKAPELLFLKDTDGDDKYDVKEILVHGLDTADTHHTSNSFALDPGGAFYFQEGTFHHTQVESPWGPARRNINGGVFKYDPRTQKFDVYVTHGFANPHGHAFEKWGQDIVIDGTGAVPYHATLFSGRIEHPNKHAKPPTVYNQRTRPCPGLEVLSSRHFPDDFQQNLLVPNVIGFQGILRYKLRDDGGSFGADELEPLLFSSDPNFRPTDCETAPDGSLYFVDWQNPLIGHLQHNLRDPNRDKTHGRIYRVTYEGRALVKPEAVAGEPIEKLVALLANPDDRVRLRAKTELGARPSDEVIAAVQKWLGTISAKDADAEHARCEALWVHQHHNYVNVELLKQVLASPDYRARAAGVRVLVPWRDRVPDPIGLLRTAAADESPRVRLEAVRAASFFDDPAAVEVVAISDAYPLDRFSNYLRGETLKTLDPLWKAEIAAGRKVPTVSEAGQRFFLRNMTLDMLRAEPRSAGVCRELLLRPGLRDDERRIELQQLAGFAKQSELQILLDAVRAIDSAEDDRDESIVFDLVRLLNGRPAAELTAVRGDLEALALKAKQAIIRQAGFIALLTIDESVDPAWTLAEKSVGSLRDLLTAVPLVRDAAQRAALYTKIVPLVEATPAKLKGQGVPDGIEGRYIRIELPGNGTLTLAEVEVMSAGQNVARKGKASQKNVSHDGYAGKAIDGNKSGAWGGGGQTHSVENTGRPWWEVDLGRDFPISSVTIYNRTDDGLGKRLDKFTLTVFDNLRQPVLVKKDQPAPKQSAEFRFAEEDPRRVVRQAAMNALASVRGKEAETFALIAPYLNDELDRIAAVRALQKLPRPTWPKERAEPLVKTTLEAIRKIPAAQRTEEDALDLFDFSEALAVLLPADRAKQIRAELGELGVRVVKVGTVLERMTYDKDVLVVRAGKPVEIVFSNDDMMPHNLVITQPGMLEEIGNLAESLARDPAHQARGYVPNAKGILLKSKLLQPRESQKLSFNAPTKPGVYPIVCTYPGHWRRMYAALYVVEDLDEYLANPDAYLVSRPLEVKDPLLADRRPRTEWKLDDLAEAMKELSHGRSFGTGKQMFQAAACIACHKLDNVGNAFGPDLTKLDPKWGPTEILKELLDPSARINEKFQTYAFVTESGKTITGLVIEETPEIVKVIENPLAKSEPVVLKKSEIEDRVVQKISIMPKGLLDKLTRDEIMDLIAFLTSRGDKNHALFEGGHDHGTPTSGAASASGHQH